MSWYKEYRASLKIIELEELPDLFFFRPMAFMLVKAVYHTPLTPDQISALAMLCGIIAGICMGQGTAIGTIWGGIFITGSMILDCADGQLARLKKNGTPVGRIIDGLVDYSTSTSVYVGMGIGFIVRDSFPAGPLWWWAMIVAAGLSAGAQAMIVDYFKNLYNWHLSDHTAFAHLEQERLRKEKEALKDKPGKTFYKFLLSVYLLYSGLQTINQKTEKKDCAMNAMDFPAAPYVKENRNLVRLWALNGPTMQNTALVLSALFLRPDLFLAYILCFGWLWTLLMLIVQRFSDKRMAALAMRGQSTLGTAR
jgi:phosphatidylglycerophosphate synthase